MDSYHNALAPASEETTSSVDKFKQLKEAQSRLQNGGPQSDESSPSPQVGP